MLLGNETIVALATPPGEGGLAIVRVSGREAFHIVDCSFKGKLRVVEMQSWKACFGKFYFKKNSNILEEIPLYDQVIIIPYKAPHSYTKEDLVEICCHGGSYIAQKIIDTIVKNGARIALPGEYTMKAFLNGRLDLSQAEAVLELINAKNDLSLGNFMQQIEGVFSKKIHDLKKSLVDIISMLELDLDFSEENISFANKTDISQSVERIKGDILKILDSYSRSKLIKDGIKVILIGKPNVGKSSLLNCLLKENRAIVSNLPGTTRDIIEEQLTINGVEFRIIDSAGIIETKNPIELEGIKRTKMNMIDSNILLGVIDGSEKMDENDLIILKELNSYSESKTVLILVNKSDLNKNLETKARLTNETKVKKISVSAINGNGIDDLCTELVKTIKDKKYLNENTVSLTNARQKNLLEKAMVEIENAKNAIDTGLSSEFPISILRNALEYLKEILGEVTSEDILNNIFSKFCIGK